MAYRDDVAYIEQMNPDRIEFIGRECLSTKDTIKSVLSWLTGVAARLHWESDTRELVDRRLGELVARAEALYHAFEKAGPAIVDYADAQRRAQRCVRDGVGAEEMLKALIAPIVATQSSAVQDSDALRQWHDLRETTGPLDYLAEAGVREAIDRVRGSAQSLWYQATQAYDLALGLEHEARLAAMDQLRGAGHLVPDHFDKVSALEGHKYHIGPPVAPPMQFDRGFPYDPTAVPTVDDAGSYLEWTANRHVGAPLKGLPDAGDAYGHYLNGTGTDYRFDYEKAYADDARIRRIVDTEILSAQREAERLFAESGQDAFQMTGRASNAADLVADLVDPYPAETENWQKALGGHYVYGTSDVVVQGDQITMKIIVHAEDMYNFNPGGKDIATGTLNEVNGRFSTLGWAKEFRSYGALERTITWTIGELPNG